MKTLFIDRKNAELEVERNRLIVRIGGQRPNVSIPTQFIDMLVISASVHFDSTLITRLTQEKVTCVFLNPRRVEGCTITSGLMHNDARRRLWQYQAISDPRWRVQLAGDLMYYKLRQHKNLLNRALIKRPDCRLALTKAIIRIEAQLTHLPDARGIESLRGIEGAAGAAFFEAYQTLFAPSLGFNNRNRRPPKDPVNAILSLTYTLLHAEAVRTLFATGFDPLLGIYHDPTFGRESLACDLVELYRALAERWVWRLFAEQVLRLEHFSQEQTDQNIACMLGKSGREIYYKAYDQKARHWRRLMRRTTRHWLEQLKQRYAVR